MKPHIFVCVRRRQTYLIIFATVAVVFYTLILANSILMHIILKQSDYQLNDVNNKSNFLSFDNLSQQEYNKTTNGTKLVLLWSPVFSGLNCLKPGNRSFEDCGCPETRCEITSDKDRLVDSDAILFYTRTMDLIDIPHYRKSRQKWVFFNLEAPPYSHFHGLAFMNGMFNWTMTYRDDSDIVVKYGTISRNGGNSFNESRLHLKWKAKTKMAAWMVSHCSTDGNREKYVQQLQDYMDVVTFGECGIAVCPFNRTNECLENFSKQFFFYLAFENSICNEYITEKFYRTLMYDMIPVVFGGGKYSNVAPPNSYIDVLEFESPEELSSHLYKVASNFTLYANYFKWRLDGYTIKDKMNFCYLCEKLHSDSFRDHSVYHNINEWWIQKSNCTRWDGN